ncbi:MAG: terminase family protein [Gemmatimonadetes bacterium]|nr:terminase family protein [Gemmatimonadota bacterium]
MTTAAEPEYEEAWEPNSRPQSEFCAAVEDEVFVGGAKGGAKSEALLMKAVRQTHLPRYKALILRQTVDELQEMIDRSHRYFPSLRGHPHWNGSQKRWYFPNPNTATGAGGGIVKFGHCKSQDEIKNYHGGEWAYIGFDEVADVKDPQVWTKLLAENRCPNPDVRVQACASGNPGKPGHPWCKRRFIDKCGKKGEKIYSYTMDIPKIGEVTRTRRFIPSKVTDNPVYANDPRYMAQLYALPEVLRNQLLHGDWDAGYGLALEELDETVHLIPAFEVPSTWAMFGAFDWGFQHPWIFGVYAVDEDGTIFKVDTIRGRWMSDRLIAERIHHHVDVKRLRLIVAGHDCWAEHKARRDDTTPSTAERFMEQKIILVQASQARHAGLKNFREQVAWKGLLPPDEKGGPRLDADPNFFWMDTPNNRRSFESCASMVADEDDMEDAMKVDADRLTGEGGDDDYDETRYALASRPRRAMPTWEEQEVRAFARETLMHEQETTRRHQSPILSPRQHGHMDGAGY